MRSSTNTSHVFGLLGGLISGLLAAAGLAFVVGAGACTPTVRPDQLAPNDPARAVACPSGTLPARGVAFGTYTSVWCEKKDGTKHGPYLEWWENGQKKSVGQYSNGTRDGRWEFYRDNGQPDSTVEFRAGVPVRTQEAPQATTPPAAAPPPAAPPPASPPPATSPTTTTPPR